MSYTFPITPHAMFEDRFEQFVALGLPRAAVEEMRGAITDMWSDTAGGWVFEWSRLARRHPAADQPHMALLAPGCRKIPLSRERGKTAGARPSSDRLPCRRARLSGQIRAAIDCDADRGTDSNGAGSSLFRP